MTRKLITGTPMGRAVAERFVAGEALDAAIAVAKDLNRAGMRVSLDHLGEHVDSEEAAIAAKDDYVGCVEAIDASGVDANVSVKLTQLGMGLDDDLAAAHIDEIAAAASGVGTTVTIDMEESAFTETTISLFEQAQRKHGNLGIAIQAYLRRSAADLDRILPLGGHVRLCKGAYAEPPEVAFQSKDEVDQAFDRLAALVMGTDDTMPAIATHDDRRIEPVLAAAEHRTAPWEFQMLYGVRRDRQAELAAAGHAMRIYVPYGTAWYPYLTRRLAERPANMTFFLRALVGS